MSEPSVLHQGQLGQGRAAIPAHVVDVPRYLLLQLVRGKKMLLLCQAVCKGEWTDPTDSLSSLSAARLPTWDRNVPAWPRGRGCLLQLSAIWTMRPAVAGRLELHGQQAGQIYRSPSSAGMAMPPSSAAIEITHLIRRCQTCSTRMPLTRT